MKAKINQGGKARWQLHAGLRWVLATGRVCIKERSGMGLGRLHTSDVCASPSASYSPTQKMIQRVKVGVESHCFSRVGVRMKLSCEDTESDLVFV